MCIRTTLECRAVYRLTEDNALLPPEIRPSFIRTVVSVSLCRCVEMGGEIEMETAPEPDFPSCRFLV